MLIKRKDLEYPSLSSLLWGRSALKEGQDTRSIEDQLEIYLNPLGVSKKSVKETFYILTLTYLIESKLSDDNLSFRKGMKLLDILPLFKEEEILIE